MIVNHGQPQPQLKGQWCAPQQRSGSWTQAVFCLHTHHPPSKVGVGIPTQTTDTMVHTSTWNMILMYKGCSSAWLPAHACTQLEVDSSLRPTEAQQQHMRCRYHKMPAPTQQSQGAPTPAAPLHAAYCRHPPSVGPTTAPGNPPAAAAQASGGTQRAVHTCRQRGMCTAARPEPFKQLQHMWRAARGIQAGGHLNTPGSFIPWASRRKGTSWTITPSCTSMVCMYSQQQCTASPST